MATLDDYTLLMGNSEKEKRYTHHLSKASWAGARIIQEQWTPHACSLFDLLVSIFSENGKVADLQRMRTASGVNDDEWRDVLMYTAQVSNPQRLRLCSILIASPIDAQQPRQLQKFRIHEDRSPYLRSQLCSNRESFE